MVLVTAVPNTSNDSVGATGLAAGFHPRPNADQNTPPAYAQATVPPPQGVFVSQYHEYDQENYLLVETDPYSPYYPTFAYADTNFTAWADGQGGAGQQMFHDVPGFAAISDYVWPSASWPQSLPEGTGTYFDAAGGTIFDYSTGVCNPPALALEHSDTTKIFDANGSTERRTADTAYMLATGGPLGQPPGDYG